MTPYITRLGAVAGWLGVGGVIAGLIVIPTVIAGQPPTAFTEPSAVQAYFAHPELAIIHGFVTGFIALAIVPFGLGLRAAVGTGSDRDRAFADVGLGLLVVAMGINLVSGALGAALVDIATRGGELGPTFRLHEVLYNGLADVLEGGWVAAFSLSMLGGAMPRWLGWFGVALGLAHWVKALEPFVQLTPAIDLAFGPLLGIWLVATVVALTRIAFRGAPGRVASEAIA